MNVENYNNLMTKMINNMKSLTSKINDYTDGSIIKSILSSVARIIEQFYIDVRSGVRTLMRSIPYSIFDFKPKAGVKATGYVIFTRQGNTNSKSVIPIGTKVKAGDYIYETTVSGIIDSGKTDSNAIGVQAEKVGKEYNVPANSINEISSIVSQDIVSVSNPNAIEGGEDKESSYDTNLRFLIHINGLQGTNRYGLIDAVLATDGVIDCNVKEYFETNLDGEGHNFVVFIDDGLGGLSATLKDKLQKVIDGDGTDEYPGHRVFGVNYDIKPAVTKEQSVQYSITLTNTDVSVKNEIEEIIRNEFSKLKIGQTLYISSIIANIKTNSWVQDITLIEPSSNVTANFNEIIRLKEIKEVTE